jgi:hypothetical protein
MQNQPHEHAAAITIWISLACAGSVNMLRSSGTNMQLLCHKGLFEALLFTSKEEPLLRLSELISLAVANKH